MINRRFFVEALTLVASAILCAVVANLVAARDRKVAWVGDYKNALTVPPRASSAGAAAVPKSASAPLESFPQLPVTTAPAAPGFNPILEPASRPAAAIVAPAAIAARPSTAAERTAPSPAKTFPPHPDRPFTEISGEDVALLFQRKATIFDARRSSVYAEGHIPGSRSFSVWEADIDDKVKDLLSEGLDPEAPVVIYCTGGHCEDSHMLAEKLYKIGFNGALVYKDGFPDWQKRGSPVETGMPK